MAVAKILKFDPDGRTLGFPTPLIWGTGSHGFESYRTHDALKQCTKQIAVSKSFMPVLRKKSNDPVPGRPGQTSRMNLRSLAIRRLLLSTAAGAGNGGKYVRDISGVAGFKRVDEDLLL